MAGCPRCAVRITGRRGPDRTEPRWRAGAGARARRALTLEQIAAALGREVRALGGAVDAEDILGVDGDARTALDDEIRRSEQGARPWQAVAAATNAAVDLIWHLLPDAERARFQSQWRALWMARRANFPMRNARKLALFRAGQLEVLSGYVDSRHDAAGGFVTRLRTPAGECELRSRYLINATSFLWTRPAPPIPWCRRCCATATGRRTAWRAGAGLRHRQPAGRWRRRATRDHRAGQPGRRHLLDHVHGRERPPGAGSGAAHRRRAGGRGRYCPRKPPRYPMPWDIACAQAATSGASCFIRAALRRSSGPEMPTAATGWSRLLNSATASPPTPSRHSPRLMA